MLKDHHDGCMDSAESTEPEAARGQRVRQDGRREVGARRTRVAGRAVILWPLRATLGGELLGPAAGTTRLSYRSPQPDARAAPVLHVRRPPCRRRDRPRASPCHRADGDRGGVEAERRYMEARGEQRRIVELELRRPDMSLARGTALRCLRSRPWPDRRAAREELGGGAPSGRDVADAVGRGADAWPGGPFARLRRAGRRCQRRLERARRDHAPRQRLLHALVADVIADAIPEAVREVVLTIHGEATSTAIPGPQTKSSRHGCRTPEEALAVMRSMAARWSDKDIAASLNRIGMPAGQGKRGPRTGSAGCGGCTEFMPPLRREERRVARDAEAATVLGSRTVASAS